MAPKARSTCCSSAAGRCLAQARLGAAGLRPAARGLHATGRFVEALPQGASAAPKQPRALRRRHPSEKQACAVKERAASAQPGASWLVFCLKALFRMNSPNPSAKPVSAHMSHAQWQTNASVCRTQRASSPPAGRSMEALLCATLWPAA